MNRTALVLGTVLVVPLLVFLALSFRSDPRTIDSPLIGQPAPEFALVDLEGRPLGSRDLLGKPALLNFWASWCQPCIVEHPVLQAGAQRYRGQVNFVGIIYQDEPANIRRFIRQRGAWGPSLVDETVEVALAYGVYGAPETFFLDRNGVVAEKVTGPVSAQRLVEILEPLL